MEKMRLDVWLWATRQVKSRSLAAQVVKGGHVRINGSSAKPSSAVRVGDELRLRVHGYDRVLRVLQLLPKRVGAPQAVQAYLDLTPPRPVDPSQGACTACGASTATTGFCEFCSYCQNESVRRRLCRLIWI